MPKRKIEQVEQDESEGFYGNTEGSESTDDSSNQSSNSGEIYCCPRAHPIYGC